jgi:hypothetical protein
VAAVIIIAIAALFAAFGFANNEAFPHRIINGDRIERPRATPHRHGAVYVSRP